MGKKKKSQKKKLNKKLKKSKSACKTCSKKYEKLELKYQKLQKAYDALKEKGKTQKKSAPKSSKDTSKKVKKKAPKSAKNIPKKEVSQKVLKPVAKAKVKIAKAPKKAPITKKKAATAPKAPVVKKAPVQKAAPAKKPVKPAAKSSKPSESQILAKIKKNAASVNFGRIGKASASQKDNLKKIRGIGPFLENRLNALGIFTFVQISKFTKEDELTVNAGIEYFPGRIARDEWVKQAKEILAAS